MRASSVLLLCSLLVVACEGRDGTGQATSSDVDVANSADDTADGQDSEHDGGCKDLRHPGDGLDEDDECWDPPLHYCSGGWAGAGAFYCSADGTVCCSFFVGCAPCGWEELACRPRSSTDPSAPECPDAAALAEDPVCRGFHEVIQLETEICWDGVEPLQR